MDIGYWIRRKRAVAPRRRGAAGLPPFMLPRKAPATPFEDSLLRLKLPLQTPFATPRSKPRRPPRRDPADGEGGSEA